MRILMHKLINSIAKRFFHNYIFNTAYSVFAFRFSRAIGLYPGQYNKYCNVKKSIKRSKKTVFVRNFYA